MKKKIKIIFFLIFDNTAVHLYVGYAFSARLVPFWHHEKKNNRQRKTKNLCVSIQTENKSTNGNSSGGRCWDGPPERIKQKQVKCWHEKYITMSTVQVSHCTSRAYLQSEGRKQKKQTKSYSTVKKYSSMRVEAAVPFTRLISYNIK